MDSTIIHVYVGGTLYVVRLELFLAWVLSGQRKMKR